jgi:iron complex outermembrane receptor protein
MIASRLAIAAALAAIPINSLSAESTVVDADSAAAGVDATEPVPGNPADSHAEHKDEVVVTGVRRTTADVLGGVSVLDEAELARETRPSIGETLARQPGVSATSFGPTASAPILRGLSGDRVRVLVDGIGSLDLASSGPDHAIAINPLTAERIEVLRGPTALLFGSSAIGGVVNVIDTRIPRHVPDNVIGVDGLAEYGSAAEQRSANLAADLPVGGNFVLHADWSYSKTDDLQTGGHLLSQGLRRQALTSSDPAIQALADLKGELPNTSSRTTDIAAGAAYADGALNVGLSVSRHNSSYGVPIRFSLDPNVEAEAPTIDAHQTRVDARAEIPVGGFIERVNARGGVSKYRHSEIEDTGEVGTRFFSKGAEGRVELVQTERAGWGGTTGVQYLDRDGRIRGEEKFLPDSRQRQTGLFTVQTLVRGALRLEGGVRLEFSRLTAEADEQLATPERSRRFTTMSGSVGGSFEFTHGWRAGVSVSSSARAPSIDELFANGPHLASQSFERGNPALDPERSLSIEGTLRGTAGPVRLSGSLFYSRFSNFIFQAPVDEITDELPVFEYRQGRANYYGFEAEAEAKLGTAFGIEWVGEVQADAVRAKIKDFGPAPFIPPLRILAAISGSRAQFDGRLEVERAFAHRRTAPNETETPGYTLMNASLDWHPFAANPELTLGVSANNLFDVVARRSTSILKDYAPLAGRDIRLTARLGI